MQNKTEIRRALLAARNAIPAAQRASLDSAIAAKILDWWRGARAPSIGVYWPMRGEPDLHSLYEELAARGVRLALPSAAEAGRPLQFLAWTPGELVVTDRFGAGVPAAGSGVLQPHALIIPCVGFDRARFRLGYGGGFYDRTLAHAPRPYTLGVAYDIAETRFEVDPYDVALDRIVTNGAELIGA